MYKKIATTLIAIILLPVIAKADVTETISSMTFTEVAPPKERKQADHFFIVGLQAGITDIPEYDIEVVASGMFGYKKQIGKTDFLVGGQLSIGSTLADTDMSGFFIDVAPTISYLNKAGGFYNSFEATLGLGLGYRQGPSDTFAFTPELNLTYWFNWFGVGATIRYSFQKDDEYGYYNYYYYFYDSRKGSQLSAVARFAVRF